MDPELLNLKNELRYTKLHSSIFDRDFESFCALLNYGADPNIKCQGTPLIHLTLFAAALPGNEEFGFQCFDKLVAHGECDFLAKDDQYSTIMHVAAEFNFTTIIHSIRTEQSFGAALPILFDSKDRSGMRPLHRSALRGASEATAELIDCGKQLGSGGLTTQSTYGWSPLHTAAAGGCAKIWHMLVLAGADVTQLDCWDRSPVDVAVVNGYIYNSSTQELSPQKLASENADSEFDPSNTTTAIVTHKLCQQHYTCPPDQTESVQAPPENKKRLTVLLDELNGNLHAIDLRRSEQKDTSDSCPLSLAWNWEPTPATLSDVLRVHEWSHIRFLQFHCEQLQSREGGPGGDIPISYLDSDTTFSPLSYQAAMMGAGSVCTGVDMVMKKYASTSVDPSPEPSIRNAFCAVRPPGHHAGPRGIVKEEGCSESRGFCLLNNISIGAAYAMNMYRDRIQRVAIVDFDVHHGNGTEETVRWLSPSLETTKMVTPYGFGEVQTPRYKPWYDKEDASNVLFVSVHGYGPRERRLAHLMPQAAFYPGTGRTVIPEVPMHTEAATRDDQTGLLGDESLMVEGQSVKVREVEAAADVPGSDMLDEEDSEEDEDFCPPPDEDDERDHMVEGSENDESRKEGGSSDEDDDDFGGEDCSSDEGGVEEPTPNIAGELNLLRTMHDYASSAPEQDIMKPLILDVGVALPHTDQEAASGYYRHHWRNYFREEIYTRLMDFKPDMIFISAGFDAHRKDDINGGYIALVEEDFDWVTTNLVKIANSCCDGRIVSALEGGYQTKGEYCSAFAKSVKAHVSSLHQGCRTRAYYNHDDSLKEKSVERELLDIAEEKRLAKLEIQRQRQMQFQEEQQRLYRLQQLQQEGNLETFEQTVAPAATSSSVSTAPVDCEEPSTKRSRRGVTTNKVDYVALALQLEQEQK